MSVYLSLGSNVGNRLQNLRAAVEMLRAEHDVTVLRESRVYETDPVGEIDQGPYLNMAVAIEAGREPEEFLGRLQGIERELGREATHRWGPRVIDIDIVLWANRIIDTGRLIVPHPEFHKRAFVLIPLSEIGPLARDPRTEQLVCDLRKLLARDQGVRLYGGLNSA